MMEKKFNDPPHHEPNYWGAERLSDLLRVARRFERSGMRGVLVVIPDLLVAFHDPQIGADVQLSIEPWFDGDEGWYWYERIEYDRGSSTGPMGWNRWLYACMSPSWVVRSYYCATSYERRSLRKKGSR